MNQETPEIVVGIDVSKARLDVTAANEDWSVSNDIKGISKLITRLKELTPKLVVIESTGGLERAAMAEMSAGSTSCAGQSTESARVRKIHWSHGKN